jgi:hypothetical protein
MKFKTLCEAIMSENEEYGLTGYKRVTVRGKGRGTTDTDVKTGGYNKNELEKLGWFANKYNRAEGWVIYKLHPQDIKWLKDEGIKNLNGIVRTATRNGTSIAKFDAKKGTYAFMDNEHLDNTDEARFEKMSPYSQLFVDEPQDIQYFNK